MKKWSIQKLTNIRTDYREREREEITPQSSSQINTHYC